MAYHVDPMLDPDMWASRVKLSNLLRDPKLNFNGTIANIALTVMADPYDRLLDAPDRGFNLGARPFRLISIHADSIISKCHGFSLTAEPKSTRPDNLGQLQAELWYYPIPLTRNGRGGFSKQSSRHYEAIRRVVSKPKLERERLITSDADAKRIGFRVLQAAMRRPLSVPMQD